MTESQILFIEIGQSIDDSDQSQLFGKPCFKVNGKAFVSFFENAMVFKLNDDVRKKALSLSDSKLFDPSGKNRPMKEWVQVPFKHKNEWLTFAKYAAEYVKEKSQS